MTSFCSRAEAQSNRAESSASSITGQKPLNAGLVEIGESARASGRGSRVQLEVQTIDALEYRSGKKCE